MSQLFDVSIPAINQHLKNIYETKELTPEATIKKNLIVQQEGNRQDQIESRLFTLSMLLLALDTVLIANVLRTLDSGQHVY